MSTIVASELMKPAAVAEMLGIEEQTLAAWRCTKRYNLPFVRVGRSIRYSRASVDKFCRDRTVKITEPTAV
jgi:hypothetical protein